MHFSFYVCLRLAVRGLEVVLLVLVAELFDFVFERIGNALCVFYDFKQPLRRYRALAVWGAERGFHRLLDHALDVRATVAFCRLEQFEHIDGGRKLSALGKVNLENASAFLVIGKFNQKQLVKPTLAEKFWRHGRNIVRGGNHIHRAFLFL
nr:hypothetical protein [Treponema sp.]